MNMAFSVLKKGFSSFRSFLVIYFLLFLQFRILFKEKEGTHEWLVELELGAIHCMPCY